MAKIHPSASDIEMRCGDRSPTSDRVYTTMKFSSYWRKSTHYECLHSTHQRLRGIDFELHRGIPILSGINSSLCLQQRQNLAFLLGYAEAHSADRIFLNHVVYTCQERAQPHALSGGHINRVGAFARRIQSQ